MNLENKISAWRNEMLAVGIKTPVPLEELESHLREEIERQMKSGLDEPQAFEIAVQKIGVAGQIKIEFKKADAENWNRSLAWSAWMLFAASFFLPSYANERGWQCAGLSLTAIFWPDFWHGWNWFSIHLVSLTFANLLLVASPFLLARFSKNAGFVKWFRIASFATLALVWSFLLLIITQEDGQHLKIGSYVWGLSFLPLCLATLKISERAMRTIKP